MLKLKNVSKFYYNKGVVATGFTKVNLTFEMGEFVAITGESGSGKSTLLNVISGLDTYEEGEMYINGKETSHYQDAEFEEYRKKYIGNIFQNFNLINSYTVYQNVELILLLNGYKKKECKKKALEILEKVGILEFKKQKVSRLSGGQKQRVAIARALAKDTPIIVADEPTGNLDSKAAKEILKLLYEISKDKLVIIVTHNYEQVEEYATRNIKMHDGKIMEDKYLKEEPKKEKYEFHEYKNMRFFNKIKIGVRNTFNIATKFALLFMVYLFITLAITAVYSSLQKQRETAANEGYNSYFRNTSDKRIVIKKADNSPFTDVDYEEIEKLGNIDKIIKDDLILDVSMNVYADFFSFYGNALGLNFFEGKLDHGRMPENEYEMILEASKDFYVFQQGSFDELLEKEYEIASNYSSSSVGYKLKIVGVKLTEENYNYEQKFYISDKVLNDLKLLSNQQYSTIETNINNTIYKSDQYSSYYKVTPNYNVPMGEAYITEDMDYFCYKQKCAGTYMTVNIENLFYKNSKEIKITRVYNKNNFKNLTGLPKEEYDYRNGEFYINPVDYNNLFLNDYYQSSVFIKDVKTLDETINSLKDLGLSTMYVKDSMVRYEGSQQVLDIVRTVFIIILMAVLFFVSYFIIKLILKSRNIYFSTIRILGASKKVANSLLKIELYAVVNMAFLIYIIFILLFKFEYLKIDYIRKLIEYLTVGNYILIYVILILMSYLIANRFSRKLFKKSAMNTYREEV